MPPVDDLPGQPPATSVEGTLPPQLTSLIGRREALAELAVLLGDSRLLTLIGAGGSGKSRLALGLAERELHRYPGGVRWVELSAVPDAALIPAHVAGAVGLSRQVAESTTSAIARRLDGEPVLLVLDNCEHVADGCAALVVPLLSVCPGLTVLATSRQPLAVPGEQLFRVPGLSLPTAFERTAEPGAIELFHERATHADPSFTVSDDTRAAVMRICRRLDGMPLALELAGAHVGVLGIGEIAERLEHDSGFLRRGSPSAPPHQRTLHATLEWSHRMLAPVEQTLFRRLGAFPGGFSLAAAEAVGAGGDLGAADVLEGLGGLVDRSLVQLVDHDGETRFRLLETVRQFGAHKLAESGEQAVVHEAHAVFYLALAEEAQAGLASPGQATWLVRLDTEQDNFRTVQTRRLAGPPHAAARLAALLWPFWWRRGAYEEGRRWLERAVASDSLPPAIQAGVLTGAGVLAALQCDYGVATQRLDAALELERRLGNRRGAATALQRLGSIAREQGRYGDARRLHEESLAEWRALGDAQQAAASEDYLGFAAWLDGEVARAAELCGRALETFRAAGRAQETAAALVNLGAAASYAGDAEEGRRHLEEALAISREIGYSEGVAWALNQLGILARRAHDVPRAAALLRESLLLHRQLGDRWRTASVLEELGGGLLARVEPAVAAELVAAAAALRDALGTPLPPVERPDLERALRALRHRLGTGAFAHAAERGRALGPDAVLAAAIDATDRLSDPRAPRRRALDDLLTERELAVLSHLSSGRTNREIAAELYISPSTAGVHVSNILRKLGVTSRVQAATIAQRLGVPAPDEGTGAGANVRGTDGG